MGTTPQLNFTRKFDLDPSGGILTPESAGAVEVSLSSDADVVTAIAGNQPLPSRPNGRIELGRIALTADAGRQVVLGSGGLAVAFNASAGAFAGAGIFDEPKDAIAALGLEESPGFDFAISPAPSHRYLLMRAGYQVTGSVQGKHPIGALGAATFGVEGKREAHFAVLHRFPATQGAHDVFRKAVASWRLPRQISSADHLAPGAWIIAESDGQVAVNLAAQLGYDFTFVRDLKSIGLTGDIGFKIDAAARATLGFEVSGRYLVVLGREDASPASKKLRLRLFKLQKKGHSFGLNFAVGVKGISEALPDSVDDFVKSVFGVHGRQVVKDLLVIEQWTDPSKDLSDTVAALARQTGFDLLRRTTGIDPETAFNQARDRLLTHLRLWDRLPENAAAATWQALESVAGNDAALAQFHSVVASLADPDEKKRTKALSALIAEAAAPHLPELPVIGRVRADWISALADRGLLALLNRVDEIHESAVLVQQVLDGGVIGQLQGFLAERLNLDALRRATDFHQVDAWLVARLSQLLDEHIDQTRLEEVRTLVHTVVKKRQEVYAAARKALSQRYSASLAANYARTTASTALLDAEFDLEDDAARALFERAVGGGGLDDLLTTPASGVRLHEAILSHSVEKRASIEVTLPQYNARRDHIRKMLASVRASDEGGRILLYQMDASDTVTVRNKLRSELAIGAVFAVGNLRVRSTDRLSWSYRYAAVQPRLRRAGLEARIGPFVSKYLPDAFAKGGPSSFDTWITDLDRAVEDVLHNGANEFGDTILDMQVIAPGAALAAWFRERSPAQRKQDSMEMSRRIQGALKQLVPFYYLSVPERLHQNPTVAALLTWQAIPVSTSVKLRDGQLILDTQQEVYWDWMDRDIRGAMVQNSRTTANLAASLALWRKSLLDAGETDTARMFEPGEVADFQALALTGMGDTLLGSLLAFEALAVHKAEEALKDIASFLESAQKSPSRAIERLAEAGGDLTDAFHGNLSSVYGGDAIRALGSLVFLEATCALDPALRARPAAALLRILVVRPDSGYALTDFLKGVEPPPEAIALAQTLATALS